MADSKIKGQSAVHVYITWEGLNIFHLFFYLIIKFFRSLAVAKKNFPKIVLFIKKLCSKVFKCHYSGCPTHYFHLHFYEFHIKGVNINLRKLVQWKEQSLRIFYLYSHLNFFLSIYIFINVYFLSTNLHIKFCTR